MENLQKKSESIIPVENRITDGLDYYKLTMSQFIYNKEPAAIGTFTFKNRGEQRLADYIDVNGLQAKLQEVKDQGFSQAELNYIASLNTDNGQPLFSNEFIDFIAAIDLPEVDVVFDEESDDIAISTTGNWAAVTFWETIVMSEVNEMYFANKLQANGIQLEDAYREGDLRLSEKITALQQNPDIKIVEFGTRRRFSREWQKHVISRLATECPNNLVGTSNIAFAHEYGLKPIGTFAHELPMGYAGLADARDDSLQASHGKMLDDWYSFYGDELAIALSDTFGSDFFFDDFTKERSTNYRATRHDSGDPFVYADKTIEHYKNQEIDTSDKAILFSDGLTIDLVRRLHEYTKNRINDAYGIGTNLTNDLGQTALNIVMKLTEIGDSAQCMVDTVKLSDDPGKHTGPEDKVMQYQQSFQRTLCTT